MVKELQIWRVGGFENDGIVMKKQSARIVAQLQYEYALNLLQRFGATMSRVGLDFLNNQIVIVLPMSNQTINRLIISLQLDFIFKVKYIFYN